MTATKKQTRQDDFTMNKKWVDLRQPYYNQMSFAQGLGPPEFNTVRLALGESIAHITFCRMTTHHGTHVDAPRHLVPEGKTIDEYPFEHFAGEGVILDMRRDGPVALTAADCEQALPAVKEGDIVLFYTGWADKFGSEEYSLHPYLGEDAAWWLVKKKVRIVGIDTKTVDIPSPLRKEDFNFPVHKALLGNDILIIEHLGPGLKQVLNKRVTIACFPLKITGADGAPAPVFALVET